MKNRKGGGMGLGYYKSPCNQRVFNHNYIRTFRKNEVPVFGGKEKKMLQDWLAEDKITEIFVYLSHEKYKYELSTELIEFLILENFENGE